MFMDNLDFLLNAALAGVVAGVFFMVVGAFFKFGWKYWHVIAIAALIYYFI